MAAVADTRTSTDAHLANRQLQEGNAKLIQERDILLREIRQWQPVLSSLRAEIAAHLHLPEVTSEIHALLSTNLVAQKEALQREIDEKTAKSQDLDVQNGLKERKGRDQEATIAQKSTHMATLQASATEWEEKARLARVSHENAVAVAQSELPPLLEEVNQARNHLAGVKLEEEVLLQNRINEDVRLSTKNRDLAIYEDRIRQAAAKVGIQINL